MENLSYQKLLKTKKFPSLENNSDYLKKLRGLQERMLFIQRGIYHQKDRAIIVFEGMDAGGKGGCIRRITELLDPRGFHVHAIGPPDPIEQGTHWLYRFWKELPIPGTIAIFDRSWYGRLLVERVELGLKPQDVKRAFQEIRDFERTLVEDGVKIVKIFLGISKEEQLKRLEERLNNPFKQWKLNMADIESRKKFDDYVAAIDAIFKKTHTPNAPWYLVPANAKHYTRLKVLQIITNELKQHEKWIKDRTIGKQEYKTLEAALKELGISAKAKNTFIS
jgi:polyphosphate kinase 2 (PPK2 family)